MWYTVSISVSTVSYTHLAVYKRQVIPFSRLSRWTVARTSRRPTGSSIAAVSYTHLELGTGIDTAVVTVTTGGISSREEIGGWEDISMLLPVQYSGCLLYTSKLRQSGVRAGTQVRTQ